MFFYLYQKFSLKGQNWRFFNLGSKSTNLCFNVMLYSYICLTYFNLRIGHYSLHKPKLYKSTVFVESTLQKLIHVLQIARTCRFEGSWCWSRRHDRHPHFGLFWGPQGSPYDRSQNCFIGWNGSDAWSWEVEGVGMHCWVWCTCTTWSTNLAWTTIVKATNFVHLTSFRQHFGFFILLIADFSRSVKGRCVEIMTFRYSFAVF